MLFIPTKLSLCLICGHLSQFPTPRESPCCCRALLGWGGRGAVPPAERDAGAEYV